MSELINSIKNLREISGAGILDCKNALKENSLKSWSDPKFSKFF